jgi:hypothetical protein
MVRASSRISRRFDGQWVAILVDPEKAEDLLDVVATWTDERWIGKPGVTVTIPGKSEVVRGNRRHGA